MNRFKAILQFYTGFAPAGCWFITASCAWVVDKWGTATLQALVMLKLLTLLLVYYFVQHGKRKELYFYYNMGLTKHGLFAVTFIIDLILFALVLYVINLVQ